MIELPLGKLNSELKKNLLYSLERRFPSIQFVYRGTQDTAETSLVVHHKTDSDLGEAQPEIESFVQAFRKRAGTFGERVRTENFWKNERPVLRTLNADDVEKKAALGTDLPGVFLFDEKFQSIVETIDQICSLFAQSENAVRVQIPTLLTQTHLEKAGYWNRESQQISLVSPRTNSPQDSPCLSSAACLPLYPVLGKHGLNGRSVVTSKCDVFRWEGGVFPQNEPLSRLWEYHVRELVFFAEEKEIQSVQARYIQFVKWLAEELRLSAEVSTATDTFFHPESVNLAIYQLVQQTKLEFRVFFESSILAVSSFNYHGRHFLDAFQITSKAEVQSACIGFGLERLAYACMAAMEMGPSFTLDSLEETLKKAQAFPWKS